MSAGERRRFEVRDKQGAQFIGSLVAALEPGWTVTIAPAGRSLSQNDAFHGYCDAIAKALPEWNGMSMTADDWKQLLILSHAMATDGSGVRLVKDLEGSGLVQLRESSARMSKARATSLIEYVVVFAVQRGIQLQDRP